MSLVHLLQGDSSVPRETDGDQTGSNLVPVSEWTMEKEGAKQVAVVGKENKREITVPLSVAASGNMLAPQVIYQGKTEGCHAKVTFPEDWNVTHSETHWSTESTTLEYIDKVLVPYVTHTRQKLELAKVLVTYVLPRQGKSLSLPWTIQPLLCLMSSRLIDVTLSLETTSKSYPSGVHTSWMHWGVATP